jgi:hypothetical protein
MPYNSVQIIGFVGKDPEQCRAEVRRKITLSPRREGDPGGVIGGRALQ